MDKKRSVKKPTKKTAKKANHIDFSQMDISDALDTYNKMPPEEQKKYKNKKIIIK